MEEIRFEFGRNWDSFISKCFSEEKVEASKSHILNFLGFPSLQGKYVLDVGCGSGLSSLAALRAGAKKIVSFDYDIEAVKTTKKLKEYAGNPSNWEVFQGSILDQNLIKKLEPADLVYSWGVLHHTGNMWEAIKNAASLVSSRGLFYIAIYLKTADSSYWHDIKKLYNSSTESEKNWMLVWHLMKNIVPPQLHGTDLTEFFRQKTETYTSRGMDYYTDIVDWLGGYPFEYATPEEIINFCTKDINFHFVRHQGCEYLFKG